MKHTGTVLLKTESLILRPFRIEDAEAVFRNWACDLENVKYLSWRAHQTSGVTRTVVSFWLKDYRKPSGYHWCITLKGADDPIGGIDVVRSDEHLECAELGFCISRQYWGRGFATEAGSAVLNHLLYTVGYKRISGRCLSENRASAAVLSKIGMKREGLLRSAAKTNIGEFSDVLVFASVRE